MTKKTLLADMVQNPARFYRMPSDVLRDRRFDDAERAAILRAWSASGDERSSADIAAVLEELQNRGLGHAAE